MSIGDYNPMMELAAALDSLEKTMNDKGDILTCNKQDFVSIILNIRRYISDIETVCEDNSNEILNVICHYGLKEDSERSKNYIGVISDMILPISEIFSVYAAVRTKGIINLCRKYDAKKDGD